MFFESSTSMFLLNLQRRIRSTITRTFILNTVYGKRASERLGQDRDSRWGHATSGALAFGAYVIEHLYYTICIELCDT